MDYQNKSLEKNGILFLANGIPVSFSFDTGKNVKYVRVPKDGNKNNILENILRCLNAEDLLKCRLVCHYWNRVATPLCQNLIKIYFYGNNEDFGLYHEPSVRTLCEFIKIFQHSTNFPCNQFQFLTFGPAAENNYNDKCDLNQNILNESFQTFLNNCGYKVRKLWLNFRPKECQRLTERVVMETIQQLILHQARNLQFLSLNLNPIIEWKVDEYCRLNWSPLRKTDSEIIEIQANTVNLNLNTNLNVLEIVEEGSAKILEVILQLAPNLQEIIIEEGNYSYLLEPFNRLHLLKNLYFDADYIDILEKALQVSQKEEQEGCLRLRQMLLCLAPHLKSREFSNPEFRNRVITVINGLLESSWNSLEILDWDGVPLNHEFWFRIKWPSIMPRVWKLEFGSPRYFSDSNSDSNTSLFPKEFPWSIMFPSLECLTFYDASDKINIVDFIQRFNFEPLETIKTVNFYWNGERIPSEQLQTVQQLFPNAKAIVHGCD